ncbi:unnamed protein product [Amoebophrya sp. A25]|nr:unnamed protein product [Amoebophrya sp. A25]|eukprot:GSA25T00002523001.1
MGRADTLAAELAEIDEEEKLMQSVEAKERKQAMKRSDQEESDREKLLENARALGLDDSSDSDADIEADVIAAKRQAAQQKALAETTMAKKRLEDAKKLLQLEHDATAPVRASEAVRRLRDEPRRTPSPRRTLRKSRRLSCLSGKSFRKCERTTSRR